MHLVSIIIPYFNDKATIQEAIVSAQNQTYKDIEIIIVDDGSVENAEHALTEEIIRATNVKCYYQKNTGLSGARNYGALHSKGEFMVFLDADDKLASRYVEECLNVYTENRDLNIVYSESELFGRETGKWKLPEYSFEIFMQRNCIPAFAMIKREVFFKVGMFDPMIKHQEDWDLWIRIISQYGGVYRIPQILHYYRKRKDKSSLTDINEKSGKSIAEMSLLYIFYKNYHVFKKAGFNFGYIANNDLHYKLKYFRLRKKYYGIWYRKLFYMIKGEKPWLENDP